MKKYRSLINSVTNDKMKAKVTKGNVDFILSLGSITEFVKEPKHFTFEKSNY